MCKTCLKVFKTDKSLLRHKSIHFTVRPKYQCSFCTSIFFYISDLRVHVNTIHQEKSFQCINCDKIFTTEKLLKIHNNKVHLQLKKYECSKFHDKFGSSVKLFRHCNNVIHLNSHNTSKILIKCFILEKVCM